MRPCSSCCSSLKVDQSLCGQGYECSHLKYRPTHTLDHNQRSLTLTDKERLPINKPSAIPRACPILYRQTDGYLQTVHATFNIVDFLVI